MKKELPNFKHTPQPPENNTFYFEKQIEKYEANLQAVKTKPNFTLADRKLLIPHYESELSKLRKQRDRANRKIKVFEPVLVTPHGHEQTL